MNIERGSGLKTLKIGPGKIYRPRNSKIMIKKDEKMIFVLFLDKSGGMTGSERTLFGTDLWSKKRYNSRSFR